MFVGGINWDTAKSKDFCFGGVELEKFVSDFIKADLIHIFTFNRFVDLSLEQTTCFNNFNLDKFLSHKKTDIQRVRERLKHEDKFGRVIKIKFNKKFQKLQYASCLCLHEWF